MIGIINYRVGNLQNLKNSLDFIGAETTILDTPENIESMSKLILPGVGAFGHAVANLHQHGFWEPLVRRVNEGTPLLGICVGMQVLFEKSYEGGNHLGLGLIPGTVERFQTKEKIPHMGWNTVSQEKNDPLLTGIRDNSWFYFVHSYVCQPKDHSTIIGYTDYGQKFCSVVAYKNIWGAQFHPEKSQDSGLQLLKNFCDYSAK